MSHFRGEWSEKPENLSNLLKVRQIVRRNSLRFSQTPQSLSTPGPTSPCNKLPQRAIPLLSRHLQALFWKDLSALGLFRKELVSGISHFLSRGDHMGWRWGAATCCCLCPASLWSLQRTAYGGRGLLSQP